MNRLKNEETWRIGLVCAFLPVKHKLHELLLLRRDAYVCFLIRFYGLFLNPTSPGFLGRFLYGNF